MSSRTTQLFGVGVSGLVLTDGERRVLAEHAPYAIVLFARNIADVDQLRALVADIKRTAARPPLMMIDQEGGRVDRLRDLIPGIPGADEMDTAPKASAVGHIIGKALRYFDIDIDLAPVVDLKREPQTQGLERRFFAREPERVVELAGAFLRALHAEGVGGCLKHYPGLGGGHGDPHYGASVLDLTFETLIGEDLVPYIRLGEEAQAIMPSHGSYPYIDEPYLPATLSAKMTNDLLRRHVGFTGVAFSDDMEMHAVSDLGNFEEIAERAMRAGNDVILYCTQLDRLESLANHLDARAREDHAFAARLDEAYSRAERHREFLGRLQNAAPPPAASFDEIRDELARVRQMF